MFYILIFGRYYSTFPWCEILRSFVVRSKTTNIKGQLYVFSVKERFTQNISIPIFLFFEGKWLLFAEEKYIKYLTFLADNLAHWVTSYSLWRKCFAVGDRREAGNTSATWNEFDFLNVHPRVHPRASQI